MKDGIIKQLYEAPVTFVMAVRQEGVLCTSAVNAPSYSGFNSTEEEW